jgi:hypothetical protein
MSVENHLVELERKHRALDQAIEHEMAQPASDTTRIAELKRKKLVLKDTITKLKAKGSVAGKTLH